MKEEMPNERMARFEAICKKIQVTENEVNVHVRNLDRLKKKLVVVSSDDFSWIETLVSRRRRRMPLPC